MILHCIPENASPSYIMLAFVVVPGSDKIAGESFAFFYEIDTINRFFTKSL